MDRQSSTERPRRRQPLRRQRTPTPRLGNAALELAASEQGSAVISYLIVLAFGGVMLALVLLVDLGPRVADAWRARQACLYGDGCPGDSPTP